MTPRKPKPKPRTDPAIRELRRAVRSLIGITDCQRARIEALEARKDLRDKSHDEPVSNAGEAVGMNLPLSDAAQIDRFFDFIRNEQLTCHWWQFWRRG